MSQNPPARKPTSFVSIINRIEMIMSFQVIGYIVKEHRSTVDNALLRAAYVGVILYLFYISFSRR